jgi:hypothetical protein
MSSSLGVENVTASFSLRKSLIKLGQAKACDYQEQLDFFNNISEGTTLEGYICYSNATFKPI